MGRAIDRHIAWLSRFGVYASALFLVVTLIALMAAPADAATGRSYDHSFGSFAERFPRGLAVDQTTGDVYAFTDAQTVSRYTSTGAPHNFTAGPDAGTNTLTGLDASSGNGGPSSAGIAIDRSGGPLDGTVYVADRQRDRILAFDSDGAPRGAITGSGTAIGTFNERRPEGLTVDQSDGSVYFMYPNNGNIDGAIWRYKPVAPSGSLDDSDYSISGKRNFAPDSLAAEDGDVFIVEGTTVRRYGASTFSAGSATADPPGELAYAAGAELHTTRGLSVAVDPSTGDLYVNQGDRIVVLNPAGEELYQFGSPYFAGSKSIAVAATGPSGPGEAVYVGDPHNPGGNQIDVFGPVGNRPALTHPQLAVIGPDGTGASSFNRLESVSFDTARSRLFALDGSAPGVFGFDASALGSYPALPGFGPLATATAAGNEGHPGIAVDGTALASGGHLYYASQNPTLDYAIYGFDSVGSSLSGFPLTGPSERCAPQVDANGHLWVVTDATLEEFEPDGSFVQSVTLPGRVAGCELAFDSQGDLYALMGPGTESENAGTIYKYDAAGGYTSGSLYYSGGQIRSIAVDTGNDHLYVARSAGTCSGSCSLPSAFIDEFDENGEFVDEFAYVIKGAVFNWAQYDLAVDSSTHNLYVADLVDDQVIVFGPGAIYPDLSTSPATAVGNDSAILHGTVRPQSEQVSECHFEYVTAAAFRVSGFSDLDSGGSVDCDQAPGSIPADDAAHDITATIGGLHTYTDYRFRLVASNAQGTAASADRRLTTAGPPSVETTGSPLRTSTTARLDGRLDPRGAETDYHFEYGTAPCGSSTCQSTAVTDAGGGTELKLVSKEVSGLAPGTTYHYRLVADNGNPDGPQTGEEVTLTTRASDDPLAHGDFPGPPDSDRAWELVSAPDTNGNPVVQGLAFSDAGDRAGYQVFGGTDQTDSGSTFNRIFAERSESGPHSGAWETRRITPPRAELVGPQWVGAFASDDLETDAAQVQNLTTRKRQFWQYAADGSYRELFETDDDHFGGTFTANEDGSRVVAQLRQDSFDPAYPLGAPALAVSQLYDLSSGSPKLISVLPDETAPDCGTTTRPGAFGMEQNFSPQGDRWITPDGSGVFFPSSGNNCLSPAQLYLRDLAAEETKLVSGPLVSGSDCGAGLLLSTNEAALFWTQSRLVGEDSAATDCGKSTDGDVYRYVIDGGELDCVTCVDPSLDADVAASKEALRRDVAVAADGSTVYFKSAARLVPEAAEAGEVVNAYRIRVADRDLAYVGRVGEGTSIGFSDVFGNPAAISTDGSVLMFHSSDTRLNAIGGQDNGGTEQWYRYDDRDRSLICVSCPQDGSIPARSVPTDANSRPPNERGRNLPPLSSDGSTLAFATPNALLAGDHNTSADADESRDIYEWRDGRQLLVTDGETSWVKPPIVNGLSEDGRDIFFIAAARLTPDAGDSFDRLYDARIGGGFNFPPPLPPCDLNSGACEGARSSSPDQPGAGSAAFEGPGNDVRSQPKKCPKGKRKTRRKGRTICVAKKHRKAKKNHRRANR